MPPRGRGLRGKSISLMALLFTRCSTSPAVAVLLLAIGCAAGERGQDVDRVAVRDSAGIRITETSASTTEKQSGWSVDSVPLLEIGAMQSEEPAYLFSSIGSIVRLSDERIAVGETRSGQVRYFSPDGRHLVSSLGRGDGPAEVRSGGGRLIVLPGDSLVVMDRLDRIVLDGEGRFVRRITLRPEVFTDLVGYGSGDGGSWTASGSYVAHVAEPLPVPLVPGGLKRQVLRIARISADLSRADTLFQIREGHYQVTADAGLASPPFYASPRFSLSATGMTYVVADGALPEVHRLHEDGGHEIVRWTQTPEAVTPADVEHWVQSFIDRSPTQEQRLRAMFAAVESPEHKPMVAWVVTGRDGEVLLGSGHPRDPAFAPVGWNVIDADGAHLGAVDLPAGFEPRDFGPDWILGEWRNELGVPFVRLYRLHRGPQG